MKIKIQPMIRLNDRFLASFNYYPPLFEDGFNRAEPEFCRIRASNDHEAVLNFLEYYAKDEKTVKSYAKEIERFLQWLWNVRHISISAIGHEDINAFQVFLADPKPKATWCGPRAKRYKPDGTINPKWRLFQSSNDNAGLKASSINTAMRVVICFFSHLVEGGYLRGSPIMRNKRTKKDFAGRGALERFLYKEQVQFIIWALKDELNQIYPDDIKQRFKIHREIFLLKLFFFTGIRLEEASTLSMGDLAGRSHHYFKVIGKGNKPRDVDLGDQFIQALKEYRLNAGYPSALPTTNESDWPLIAGESRRPDQAVNFTHRITDKSIHQSIKKTFRMAAEKLRKEAEHDHLADKELLMSDAAHIENASAHWLRHSRATYMVESNRTLTEVMDQLGHADLSTVTIYTHVLRENKRHIANCVVLEEL